MLRRQGPLDVAKALGNLEWVMALGGWWSRMLAEERRNRILEMLRDKRFVSVNDLCNEFHVSRETIRRDIDRLANESLLIKTHGGAQAMNRKEPTFASRMSVNLVAKRGIGQWAANLVPDNAAVIIDSGTTCLCAAEAMMARRNLTVFTNDIHVASKLKDWNENRVFLLGGELVRSEGATNGHDKTHMLRNYFFDIAIIGISSMLEDGVLSDYSREAAVLRKTMIAQARTAILVGDHEKFGWNAGVRVDGMKKVSYVVTNRKPAPTLARVFKEHGIETVVARN